MVDPIGDGWIQLSQGVVRKLCQVNNRVETFQVFFGNVPQVLVDTGGKPANAVVVKPAVAYLLDSPGMEANLVGLRDVGNSVFPATLRSVYMANTTAVAIVVFLLGFGAIGAIVGLVVWQHRNAHRSHVHS